MRHGEEQEDVAARQAAFIEIAQDVALGLETLRELGAKTSKQHKGGLLDSALDDGLHDEDNSLENSANDDDTE